jgi:ankyrin repeat protein
VRQLLTGGAALLEERGGPSESTPLEIAAMLGRLGVVELLLEHGAAISSRSKGGTTPLHFAALNGHAAVTLNPKP